MNNSLSLKIWLILCKWWICSFTHFPANDLISLFAIRFLLTAIYTDSVTWSL